MATSYVAKKKLNEVSNPLVDKDRSFTSTIVSSFDFAANELSFENSKSSKNAVEEEEEDEEEDDDEDEEVDNEPNEHTLYHIVEKYLLEDSIIGPQLRRYLSSEESSETSVASASVWDETSQFEHSIQSVIDKDSFNSSCILSLNDDSTRISPQVPRIYNADSATDVDSVIANLFQKTADNRMEPEGVKATPNPAHQKGITNQNPKNRLLSKLRKSARPPKPPTTTPTYALPTPLYSADRSRRQRINIAQAKALGRQKHVPLDNTSTNSAEESQILMGSSSFSVEGRGMTRSNQNDTSDKLDQDRDPENTIRSTGLVQNDANEFRALMVSTEFSTRQSPHGISPSGASRVASSRSVPFRNGFTPTAATPSKVSRNAATQNAAIRSGAFRRGVFRSETSPSMSPIRNRRHNETKELDVIGIPPPPVVDSPSDIVNDPKKLERALKAKLEKLDRLLGAESPDNPSSTSKKFSHGQRNIQRIPRLRKHKSEKSNIEKLLIEVFMKEEMLERQISSRNKANESHQLRSCTMDTNSQATPPVLMEKNDNSSMVKPEQSQVLQQSEFNNIANKDDEENEIIFPSPRLSLNGPSPKAGLWDTQSLWNYWTPIVSPRAIEVVEVMESNRIKGISSALNNEKDSTSSQKQCVLGSPSLVEQGSTQSDVLNNTIEENSVVKQESTEDTNTARNDNAVVIPEEKTAFGKTARRSRSSSLGSKQPSSVRSEAMSSASSKKNVIEETSFSCHEANRDENPSPNVSVTKVVVNRLKQRAILREKLARQDMNTSTNTKKSRRSQIVLNSDTTESSGIFDNSTSMDTDMMKGNKGSATNKPLLEKVGSFINTDETKLKEKPVTTVVEEVSQESKQTLVKNASNISKVSTSASAHSCNAELKVDCTATSTTPSLDSKIIESVQNKREDDNNTASDPVKNSTTPTDELINDPSLTKSVDSPEIQSSDNVKKELPDDTGKNSPIIESGNHGDEYAIERQLTPNSKSESLKQLMTESHVNDLSDKSEDQIIDVVTISNPNPIKSEDEANVEDTATEMVAHTESAQNVTTTPECPQQTQINDAPSDVSRISEIKLNTEIDTPVTDSLPENDQEEGILKDEVSRNHKNKSRKKDQLEGPSSTKKSRWSFWQPTPLVKNSKSPRIRGLKVFHPIKAKVTASGTDTSGQSSTNTSMLSEAKEDVATFDMAENLEGNTEKTPLRKSGVYAIGCSPNSILASSNTHGSTSTASPNVQLQQSEQTNLIGSAMAPKFDERIDDAVDGPSSQPPAIDSRVDEASEQCTTTAAVQQILLTEPHVPSKAEQCNSSQKGPNVVSVDENESIEKFAVTSTPDKLNVTKNVEPKSNLKSNLKNMFHKRSYDERVGTLERKCVVFKEDILDLYSEKNDSDVCIQSSESQSSQPKQQHPQVAVPSSRTVTSSGGGANDKSFECLIGYDPFETVETDEVVDGEAASVVSRAEKILRALTVWKSKHRAKKSSSSRNKKSSKVAKSSSSSSSDSCTRNLSTLAIEASDTDPKKMKKISELNRRGVLTSSGTDDDCCNDVDSSRSSEPRKRNLSIDSSKSNSTSASLSNGGGGGRLTTAEKELALRLAADLKMLTKIEKRRRKLGDTTESKIEQLEKSIEILKSIKKSMKEREFAETTSQKTTGEVGSSSQQVSPALRTPPRTPPTTTTTKLQEPSSLLVTTTTTTTPSNLVENKMTEIDTTITPTTTTNNTNTSKNDRSNSMIQSYTTRSCGTEDSSKIWRQLEMKLIEQQQQQQSSNSNSVSKIAKSSRPTTTTYKNKNKNNDSNTNNTSHNRHKTKPQERSTKATDFLSIPELLGIIYCNPGDLTRPPSP